MPWGVRTSRVAGKRGRGERRSGASVRRGTFSTSANTPSGLLERRRALSGRGRRNQLQEGGEAGGGEGEGVEEGQGKEGGEEGGEERRMGLASMVLGLALVSALVLDLALPLEPLRREKKSGGSGV